MKLETATNQFSPTPELFGMCIGVLETVAIVCRFDQLKTKIHLIKNKMAEVKICVDLVHQNGLHSWSSSRLPTSVSRFQIFRPETGTILSHQQCNFFHSSFSLRPDTDKSWCPPIRLRSKFGTTCASSYV
jgi:hypothetical protein